MRTSTFILSGISLIALAGCAVGRGPGGEIIVGAEIGTVVDTAEQGLILGAGMIPVVGPLLASLLTGAAASGVTVSRVTAKAKAEIERRRKNSDRERENLRVKLAEAEAKLVARVPPIATFTRDIIGPSDGS